MSNYGILFLVQISDRQHTALFNNMKPQSETVITDLEHMHSLFII